MSRSDRYTINLLIEQPLRGGLRVLPGAPQSSACAKGAWRPLTSRGSRPSVGRYPSTSSFRETGREMEWETWSVVTKSSQNMLNESIYFCILLIVITSNVNAFCQSKMLGTSDLDPYGNTLALRGANENYLNNLWKFQNLKVAFKITGLNIK
ncbi:Hypothetical_protein [Hexamita inflata]|uniref:Hypothetical_protein n=1 Tax=Hexamita inflata TaxID=28002 RepID=A0ABP1GXE0_9EUKA